jgi:hypothetical protein
LGAGVEMNIKEFIEELSKYDPEMEVKLYDVDRKGNLLYLEIDVERDLTEYEGDFLGIGGY